MAFPRLGDYEPMTEHQLEALMADRFPRYKQSSIAVAEELRRQIAAEHYREGERLPAERQLAQLFAVSRATVRAALQRLEEKALVTRRVGSGTFVTRPEQGLAGASREDDIAEITSPLELIEVRAALEPNMARLAVLNMTARDVERLAESLAALEAAADDYERFSYWDAQFHQRIAEGVHNPLLTFMYGRINHVRNQWQWGAVKKKVLTPERIGDYNRTHRQIFEAIRGRDGEGAVAAMQAHMNEARGDLLAR